jgi:hypothetical protein
MPDVRENASWRERLHGMLGSDDGGFEPYIACGVKRKSSPAVIRKSKRLHPDHGDVAPGNGGHYPGGAEAKEFTLTTGRKILPGV